MSRKVAYTPASTKSIVNAFSTAGFTPINASTTIDPAAKVVNSGAMTANTLKTILSIAGQGGYLSQFAGLFVDVTARTMRLKVTVDGAVIYDYTSASSAVVNASVLLVGSAPTFRVQDGSGQIRFNSSILIEAASSLTETDKFQFSYKFTLE